MCSNFDFDLVDEWDDLESHLLFIKATVEEHFNQFKSRVRQHAAELEAKLEDFGLIEASNEAKLDVEKRHKALRYIQKLSREIKLVLKSIENEFKQAEIRNDYLQVSMTNFPKLKLEDVKSSMESETVEVESMERATEDQQLQHSMETSVKEGLEKGTSVKDELEKGFEEVAKLFEESLKEEIKMKENQLEEVNKKCKQLSHELQLKEMELLKEKKLVQSATNSRLYSYVNQVTGESLRYPFYIGTVQTVPILYSPKLQQQPVPFSSVYGTQFFPKQQVLQRHPKAVHHVSPVYGEQSRPKQRPVQLCSQPHSQPSGSNVAPSQTLEATNYVGQSLTQQQPADSPNPISMHCSLVQSSKPSSSRLPLVSQHSDGIREHQPKSP